MPYNPNIHRRRSIRLKGYDYSQAGLYFVTICVQNKECLLGKIVDGEMILNNMGEMVMQCWVIIPQHFPNAVLHEYVIMPNHIHGIIQLTPDEYSSNGDDVGANNYLPHNYLPNNVIRAKSVSPLPVPCGTSRTIGSIVRGFKIGATKQLGYSIWQRNYHEHIIRNGNSHQRIANYIINNPATWNNDKFFTE